VRRSPPAIGIALRQARRKARFTQWKLARRLGWNQSLICRIELGERRCTIYEAIQIARALHLEPVDLVNLVILFLDTPARETL
jgi:predicted transcriptional regulator